MVAQAKSEIRNPKSEILQDASSAANLVRLGPAWRLPRDHCSDGVGKLDLSGPERNRDSAGCVSGRAGQTESLGRDRSGDVWFMAWSVRHLLGIALAWTDCDCKMGPLF